MGLMDLFKVSKIKEENLRLEAENKNLLQKMNDLGITAYEQAVDRISAAEKQSTEKLNAIEQQIDSSNDILSKLQNEVDALQEKEGKLSKSIITQERKLSRYKELYKSTENAFNNFLSLDVNYSQCKLNQRDFDELELIAPSLVSKLHCMDVKSLLHAILQRQISLYIILWLLH